jgi:hypothetical protein
MVPSSTSSSAPSGPVPSLQSTIAEPEKQTQYASIIPQSQNQEDQDRLQLQRTISTISHHDMPTVQYIATGDNDVVYNRFTPRRKMIIVAVVSFCSFLAPISSTTVLSAVPEVAETFNTDGSIINVSNALYMLFMGLSPCFYGPYGNIYGRKWVREISLPTTCKTWTDLVRQYLGERSQRHSFHCIFYRHRFSSQFGIVLRLQDFDSISRHRFSRHRLSSHRRYI